MPVEMDQAFSLFPEIFFDAHSPSPTATEKSENGATRFYTLANPFSVMGGSPRRFAWTLTGFRNAQPIRGYHFHVQPTQNGRGEATPMAVRAARIHPDDLAGMNHNRACGSSFADGHSEIKKAHRLDIDGSSSPIRRGVFSGLDFHHGWRLPQVERVLLIPAA